MNEEIKKTDVLTLIRDAKWQIKQMKQTHFAKADVLEILDDIAHIIRKEKTND